MCILISPGAKTQENLTFYLYFNIFWTIGEPAAGPKKGDGLQNWENVNFLKRF